MARLDDFVASVRNGFPDVPDEIVRGAVRDAAIEFCQRARVVESVESLRVRAGRAAHDLRVLGGVAFEVHRLSRDGRDLEPSSQYEIRQLPESTGTPTRYFFDGRGRIELYPVPEADEVLAARAVFAPDPDGEDVPDVLLGQWREAIAGGAKMRLGRQYAPFANPDQALVGEAEFERAINQAITQRARGRTNRPIRTVPVQF